MIYLGVWFIEPYDTSLIFCWYFVIGYEMLVLRQHGNVSLAFYWSCAVIFVFITLITCLRILFFLLLGSVPMMAYWALTVGDVGC